MTDGDMVVLIIVLGALAIGLLSMFVGWVVKTYDRFRSSIMSRNPSPPAPIAPSSLQTDRPQTADRPMMPVPTQDKILDIFRAMRAAGMKREAVSGAWRAAGLPFDNNLWAKAAPADDERLTPTPIAGRPTKASFYQDDPELAYQPLDG